MQYGLIMLSGFVLILSSCSSGSSGNSGGTTTTVTTKTLQGPAMTVASGAETTKCVTLHLGNSGTSMIRRIHASFTSGILRAMVYRTSATSESTIATCDTATNLGDAIGTGNSLHPLFVSGQMDLELQFPTLSGAYVGPKIADNQNITIEVTVLNATGSAIDFSGSVEFDVLPFPSGGQESDLLSLYSTAISISPHSTADSGVLFQGSLTGDEVFALLPMQHEFGTEFKIWQGTTGTPQGTLLVDNTSWSNPGLTTISNPVAMADSSHGLAIDCAWNNTSAGSVSYGLDSTSEMCMAWAYYAPAVGFEACDVNGSCSTPTDY